MDTAHSVISFATTSKVRRRFAANDRRSDDEQSQRSHAHLASNQTPRYEQEIT